MPSVKLRPPASASLPLPEWEGIAYKSVRQVHPSFERVSAMVSALGAAVALYDLDSDGLANDLCHVDPRTDRVSILRVPGFVLGLCRPQCVALSCRLDEAI